MLVPWVRLPKHCPVCGMETRETAIYVDGRVVCRNCGYVFEESVIDSGPEWRAYDGEERRARSRVGAPHTYTIHDHGLSTVIRPPRNDLRAHKLQAVHTRIVIGENKFKVEVLSELNKYVRRLGVPRNVYETAARIVRIILKDGLLRRQNMHEYIAAALAAAARIEKYPLTITDVAYRLDMDKQRVWAAYRRLTVKIRAAARAPPHQPSSFVPMIISQLSLSPQVEALAQKLLSYLEDTGLSQGKPPKPLAAAAVYLASILLDEKKNQAEIAKMIRVSDATIRNRYRDIVDNFYIEVQL